MSLGDRDYIPSETSRLFLYRKDNGEKEFLLLRKSYGEELYETPGGSIEAGETPGQCLEREALEELGINIEAEKVLDGEIQITPKGNYKVFGYTGKTDDSDFQLSGEHSDYVWASESEIRSMNREGLIIEGLESLIDSLDTSIQEKSD